MCIDMNVLCHQHSTSGAVTDPVDLVGLLDQSQ